MGSDTAPTSRRAGGQAGKWKRKLKSGGFQRGAQLRSFQQSFKHKLHSSTPTFIHLRTCVYSTEGCLDLGLVNLLLIPSHPIPSTRACHIFSLDKNRTWELIRQFNINHCVYHTRIWCFSISLGSVTIEPLKNVKGFFFVFLSAQLYLHVHVIAMVFWIGTNR